MRLELEDTKIYAKEFALKEYAPGEMEINIENGSIDIDISHMVKDLRKTDREKVWEMARKIVVAPDSGGMEYSEIEDCFGTRSTSGVLRMPVDEALEKYESWKKKHDAEAVIKSLKPQDVIAICDLNRKTDKIVLMVTRVVNAVDAWYSVYGVRSTGETYSLCICRAVELYKPEKIGRVVETTDILGEIKKIEDEWRKNN